MEAAVEQNHEEWLGFQQSMCGGKGTPDGESSTGKVLEWEPLQHVWGAARGLFY
jgi:hypothetical protein